MDRYPFASDYAAALGGAPDPDRVAREEQLAYQDPFPGAPRSSRPFLPAGLAAAPPPKRLAPDPVPADVSRQYRYRPTAAWNGSGPSPYEPFPAPGSELAVEQAKSRLHRSGSKPEVMVIGVDHAHGADRSITPTSQKDRLVALWRQGMLADAEIESLLGAPVADIVGAEQVERPAKVIGGPVTIPDDQLGKGAVSLADAKATIDKFNAPIESQQEEELRKFAKLVSGTGDEAVRKQVRHNHLIQAAQSDLTAREMEVRQRHLIAQEVQRHTRPGGLLSRRLSEVHIGEAVSESFVPLPDGARIPVAIDASMIRKGAITSVRPMDLMKAPVGPCSPSIEPLSAVFPHRRDPSLKGRYSS